MKRWAAVVVCLVLLCGRAGAHDELSRDLCRLAPEAARALEEQQSGRAAAEIVGELVKDGAEQAAYFLTAGLRRAAMLAAGVLALSLVEVLSPRGSGCVEGAVNLAGTLWITAVSAAEVESMMGLGRSVVERLAEISRFMVPAMAAAVAAGGGVSSAGAFQAASVLFSGLFLSLMERLFLPGVYLYVALCAACAVLDGPVLEKLAVFLKKAISWSLTTLLGCYTAFLALGGAAAEAADRRMVQAAKTVVSAAVPVVGRVLSDAAETVLAGAGLLRATLGTFGALAVLSIALVPVLRLGGQYLLYQGAALAAGCGGPGKLCRLLERLSGAFALILGMTAASAALLMISVFAVLRVAL